LPSRHETVLHCERAVFDLSRRHPEITMDIDVSGLSLSKDELKETTMTKLTKENREPGAPEAGAELTDEQLRGVSGGNSIDKVPNIRTPKFGPAASISQGEVNSDQTDNNLP
jgi:hypothetical protein